MSVPVYKAELRVPADPSAVAKWRGFSTSDMAPEPSRNLEAVSQHLAQIGECSLGYSVDCVSLCQYVLVLIPSAGDNGRFG